jgi:cytochrome c
MGAMRLWRLSLETLSGRRSLDDFRERGDWSAMDSFEFNKMAGAVLGTLLLVMGVSVLSGGLFTPAKPAIPGYDLPSAKAEGAGKEAPEPVVPLPVLLSKADPETGKRRAAICSTCHSFGKGEASKTTGPNLWGIVGRVHATAKDFNGYSDANKELGAKGTKWTYDEIFDFIKDPKTHMPGTKMTFAGMTDAADRAAVISYLRTLSDNPEPLPTVTAEAQPQAPAPKPGEPAPAGAPKQAPEAPK